MVRSINWLLDWVTSSVARWFHVQSLASCLQSKSARRALSLRVKSAFTLKCCWWNHVFQWKDNWLFTECRCVRQWNIKIYPAVLSRDDDFTAHRHTHSDACTYRQTHLTRGERREEEREKEGELGVGERGPSGTHPLFLSQGDVESPNVWGRQGGRQKERESYSDPRNMRRNILRSFLFAG